MSSLTRVVLAAAVVLGLSACSAKPDCDKAVAHTYKLLADDAAKKPENVRKALEEAFPKQKAESLEECKAGKPRPLTAERYKCIMAAKDMAGLEVCAK